MEIFADDTDIAVLLMYHWPGQLFDIVFTSERPSKPWSIKLSWATIPPVLRKALPFIHAFSGCDSTSAIFGLGKPSIFKRFKGEVLI